MSYINLGPTFRGAGSIGSPLGSLNKIRVCSGSIPTVAELEACTTDAQITSLISNKGGTVLWTSAVTANNGVIGTGRLNETAYSSAIATGVATYFIISHASVLTYGLILGTISDASGNGDLRLRSTQLTSGVQYKLGTFDLAMPLEFNL